jgi:cell division protein FtsA
MMAGQERIVSVLDIGSTRVKMLIASATGDSLDSILGVGTAPCSSLKRGVVVDMEGVTQAIQTARDEAERMSSYSVSSVIVNVGGTHVTGLVNRGLVAISRPGREIQKDDVDRVWESAKAVLLGPNQEIIHVIPRQYLVDGQEGIKDPLRMSGIRLEFEAFIVTGQSTILDNLRRCVTESGLKVDRLVLEGLASADAVLSSEEKEIGVACVDIGGDTTDLAVFTGGSLSYVAVLPIGGRHVTMDLAMMLKTSLNVAEELKVAYGSVDASRGRDFQDSQVSYSTASGDGVLATTKSYISDVVTSRIEEIAEAVKLELVHSSYNNMLPAGLVLTGGTAMVSHITDKFSEISGLRARMGQPTVDDVVFSSFKNPSFSTSVGLLELGIHSDGAGVQKKKRAFKGLSGLFKGLDLFD